VKGQTCEADRNGEQDSGGDQPKSQELPTSQSADHSNGASAVNELGGCVARGLIAVVTGDQVRAWRQRGEPEMGRVRNADCDRGSARWRPRRVPRLASWSSRNPQRVKGDPVAADTAFEDGGETRDCISPFLGPNGARRQ
jgi:hypothetical protein